MGREKQGGESASRTWTRYHAICERKRNGDDLRYFAEYFAEPGVVDACYARREPRFAHALAFGAQLDPRAADVVIGYYECRRASTKANKEAYQASTSPLT